MYIFFLLVKYLNINNIVRFGFTINTIGMVLYIVIVFCFIFKWLNSQFSIKNSYSFNHLDGWKRFGHNGKAFTVDGR